MDRRIDLTENGDFNGPVRLVLREFRRGGEPTMDSPAALMSREELEEYSYVQRKNLFIEKVERKDDFAKETLFGLEKKNDSGQFCIKCDKRLPLWRMKWYGWCNDCREKFYGTPKRQNRTPWKTENTTRMADTMEVFDLK